MRRKSHRWAFKQSIKKPFLCQNGPLAGEKLYLTDGATAVFTIAGETGKYVNGVWESSCAS